MAKTTIVRLTDDLDGSDAASTITFGWGGQSYEIDLSKKNATAFEKSIRPYVSAGRKAGAGTRGRKAGRRSTSEDLSAVRAWARENGFSVSDRGRVPANVVEAYKSR
ncbi:Lsr2 protein [Jatrophihabitans sp. GAS493]|uniref:histone-like nucleoid-structuring protein Lsr2 n=1 Tax=Jatrophihabitans sp. GAS493 TaxID=1907575 RepID=UPI000BB740CD|nr:Lsr2 family protein [Jatrophihabitans sp. GAS493]SOD72027.1 Lsr2 protein [Jatrophihabitans sp. GAS493]